MVMAAIVQQDNANADLRNGVFDGCNVVHRRTWRLVFCWFIVFTTGRFRVSIVIFNTRVIKCIAGYYWCKDIALKHVSLYF